MQNYRNFSFWALCVILVSSGCYGNQLRMMNQDEIIDKSDIVIVGKVTSSEIVPYGIRHITLYDISVRGSIKGQKLASLKLRATSDWSEANMNCCKVGASYILFLRKSIDGYYVSTNGNFGSIELELS